MIVVLPASVHMDAPVAVKLLNFGGHHPLPVPHGNPAPDKTAVGKVIGNVRLFPEEYPAWLKSDGNKNWVYRIFSRARRRLRSPRNRGIAIRRYIRCPLAESIESAICYCQKF